MLFTKVSTTIFSSIYYMYFLILGNISHMIIHREKMTKKVKKHNFHLIKRTKIIKINFFL